MKSYFNVLESVDLGTDINPLVSMYHSIWDKLHDTWDYNKSAWRPNTETERCILRGFKANYESTEMHIAFCLDLNSVEVDDVYGVSCDFEEFTIKQLKSYFDYALPIYQERCKAPAKRSRKTA